MSAQRGFVDRPDDPSQELQWLLPEEVVRMLQGVADVLRLDLVRDHGKPLPNRHFRDIVGSLVRALLLDHAPAQMPDLFRQLSQLDKAYFVYLLRTALIEAQHRQATQPTIPLGMPADKFRTWSSMLSHSWLPLPQNMRYQLPRI